MLQKICRGAKSLLCREKKPVCGICLIELGKEEKENKEDPPKLDEYKYTRVLVFEEASQKQTGIWSTIVNAFTTETPQDPPQKGYIEKSDAENDQYWVMLDGHGVAKIYSKDQLAYSYEVVKTNCGAKAAQRHEFHWNCLKNMNGSGHNGKEAQCPMCRAAISESKTQKLENEKRNATPAQSWFKWFPL